MFADCLSGSELSSHSRRRWTTLISFAVQASVIGLLFMLPLLYTEGLPRLAMLAPLVAPAPPPAVPRQQTRSAPSSVAQRNLVEDRLVSPPRIPSAIQVLTEAASAPAMSDLLAGVSRGTDASGGRGTVPDSVGVGLALPPPPPSIHHPPVSRMMEGNLVHRVQPAYPLPAKQFRVQGQVELRAVISREGAIENLQVLSGPAMLVQAAVDAVRQWRYRPYELNGEPVEVETQVTVNFVLSGGS